MLPLTLPCSSRVFKRPIPAKTLPSQTPIQIPTPIWFGFASRFASGFASEADRTPDEVGDVRAAFFLRKRGGRDEGGTETRPAEGKTTEKNDPSADLHWTDCHSGGKSD
eukprot:scaffold764_cov248-Pinguiococcus_pyrenoidosus.AAC.5